MRHRKGWDSPGIVPLTGWINRDYESGGFASDQPDADNQLEAMHVESIFATCLDEGSNPSSSTNLIVYIIDKQ